jgi:hypothetical protein
MDYLNFVLPKLLAICIKKIVRNSNPMTSLLVRYLRVLIIFYKLKRLIAKSWYIK